MTHDCTIGKQGTENSMIVQATFYWEIQVRITHVQDTLLRIPYFNIIDYDLSISQQNVN